MKPIDKITLNGETFQEFEVEDIKGKFEFNIDPKNISPFPYDAMQVVVNKHLPKNIAILENSKQFVIMNLDTGKSIVKDKPQLMDFPFDNKL